MTISADDGSTGATPNDAISEGLRAGAPVAVADGPAALALAVALIGDDEKGRPIGSATLRAAAQQRISDSGADARPTAMADAIAITPVGAMVAAAAAVPRTRRDEATARHISLFFNCCIANRAQVRTSVSRM
jgi:hypothetical protein